MYTTVGHCQKCGAPIYSLMNNQSILPPASIPSCSCNSNIQQTITTTHTWTTEYFYGFLMYHHFYYTIPINLTNLTIKCGQQLYLQHYIQLLFLSFTFKINWNCMKSKIKEEVFTTIIFILLLTLFFLVDKWQDDRWIT